MNRLFDVSDGEKLEISPQVVQRMFESAKAELEAAGLTRRRGDVQLQESLTVPDEPGIVGRGDWAVNVVSGTDQIDVGPAFTKPAQAAALLEMADRLVASVRDNWENAEFKGPVAEALSEDPRVSLDVVLVDGSREKARELRRWVYGWMASELPSDVLDRLDVFVTFRRE